MGVFLYYYNRFNLGYIFVSSWARCFIITALTWALPSRFSQPCVNLVVMFELHPRNHLSHQQLLGVFDWFVNSWTRFLL